MIKKALSDIRETLHRTQKSSILTNGTFFKTGPGDYAAHDRFMGVPVPALRKIAKDHAQLSFSAIQKLIQSKINEERLLALIILVNQYSKSDNEAKKLIYEFYIKNMRYVNNWNLVDASAHLIVGAYLFDKNKKILLTLAKSPILWEKRIAIVSTWYFTRQNEFEYTIKIAIILLSDKHDLIHKSVGWMLREMGKRNETVLIDFLKKYAKKMPRTMWRYATERVSAKDKV